MHVLDPIGHVMVSMHECQTQRGVHGYIPVRPFGKPHWFLIESATGSTLPLASHPDIAEVVQYRLLKDRLLEAALTPNRTQLDESDRPGGVKTALAAENALKRLGMAEETILGAWGAMQNGPGDRVDTVSMPDTRRKALFCTSRVDVAGLTEAMPSNLSVPARPLFCRAPLSLFQESASRGHGLMIDISQMPVDRVDAAMHQLKRMGYDCFGLVLGETKTEQADALRRIFGTHRVKQVKVEDGQRAARSLLATPTPPRRRRMGMGKAFSQRRRPRVPESRGKAPWKPIVTVGEGVEDQDPHKTFTGWQLPDDYDWRGLSYGAVVHDGKGKLLLREPTNHFDGYCVPLDAEILTREGWKNYKQVSIGDETIGFDPQLKKARWTRVTAVHHLQKQQLVQYGNRKTFSVRCTSNHRWLTVNRGDTDTTWEVVSAMRRLGKGSGSPLTKKLVLSVEHEDCGRSDVTPDEAALLAWIVTDGCMSAVSRRKGCWECQIVQLKPEGIKAIDALMERLDFPHTKRVDYGGMAHYRLQAHGLRRLLDRTGYTGSKSCLLRIVLSLSSEANKAFIDAAYLAEGNIASPGRKCLYQNAGPCLDAMQVAAYRAGYFSAVREFANKSKLRTLSMMRPEIRDVSYHWLNQRADVWCVTTELGTWTMRQGPYVCLTGNCWTFAKGKKDNPHESPASVARREVGEEMGVAGQITGYIPGAFRGGTGKTYYYLMQYVGDDREAMDAETASTKWATPDEAAQLISQTENSLGRSRDLAVLKAAAHALHLPYNGPMQDIASKADTPPPPVGTAKTIFGKAKMLFGKLGTAFTRTPPAPPHESLVEDGSPTNLSSAKRLANYVASNMKQAYLLQVVRPTALYKARKKYDRSRAHMLSHHLMIDGGRKLARSMGLSGAWHKHFSEGTRLAAQKILRNRAERDAASRRYDALLPKKYQKGFKGYDNHESQAGEPTPTARFLVDQHPQGQYANGDD